MLIGWKKKDIFFYSHDLFLRRTAVRLYWHKKDGIYSTPSFCYRLVLRLYLFAACL